jgi:signal peptidase I
MAVALIAILVAVFLLSLLVSSGLLWAGAKLTRIPDVRFRRCLGTVLAATVVDVLIALGFRFMPGVLPPLPTALLEFGVELAATFLVLKLLLRASYLRAILAGFFWMVTGGVYAVAIVFVLKTFLTEAFVVPTGSMATTLWGYQKLVECPECGFTFPLNSSSQVDPQNLYDRDAVMGCTCPNCRYAIHFRSANDPPWNGGDRFIALKMGYGKLERFQVAAFDYPEEMPNVRGPIRYIARVVGLPGDTVGIHGGKLYVAEGFSYDDSQVPPEQLRRLTHSPDGSEETPENRGKSEQALETFKRDVTLPANDPRRKFHLLRKSPELLLTLSRPVYDNDFQARDQQVTRWYAPQQGWTPDNAQFPRRFTAQPAAAGVHWLRYRHVLRDSDKPALITDFFGYNTGNFRNSGDSWVGDLMIEAEFQLDKAAKGDELWLELSKGVDRFQARFDLESGSCTLARLTKPDNQNQVLAQKDTPLKAPGTYRLRLANVDERLTLWVNDQMPFGDGQIYDPAKIEGPDAEPDPGKNNDLNPAGIGVKGAPGLGVAHVKLARDNYYTADVLGAREYNTLYVQPGHFLFLGDNSRESADSRVWGLVPERLLIGPAILTYWPPARFGWIH